MGVEDNQVSAVKLCGKRLSLSSILRCTEWLFLGGKMTSLYKKTKELFAQWPFSGVSVEHFEYTLFYVLRPALPC